MNLRAPAHPDPVASVTVPMRATGFARFVVVWVLMLLCAFLACSSAIAAGRENSRGDDRPSQPHDRPNVLLIVADDLGYSDLGIYGSEIETPQIDELARGGMRFTNFYASSMCSTTRSMLLTGMDHHLAGLGNLAERLSENQKGQAGYEGHINQSVATLAEVLQDAGYDTFMAGKWHLGSAPGSDPSQRGFDRSFALQESGAGHFSNMLPLRGPGKAEYTQGGARLDSLPEDFYSTRHYARTLVRYLESREDNQDPFFAYLAFTAPHFPLQAPRESIAKFKGKYDRGFEAIHADRLQRMKRLGLVGEDVNPFPQLAGQPNWDSLSPEDQSKQARVMEIYAAMISDLDRYVGEVIEFLRSAGLYDNTLIIFMSDNGAEGHYLHWGLNPLVEWSETCCNNTLENLGNADSYQMLGPDWARVSSAPLRMFKGFTSEGGVRVPAFMHFPRRFSGGGVNTSLATVKDIMPTILELAGVDPPGKSFRNREVLPMQGVSLLPVLEGARDAAHEPGYAMGWEIFGKRALRQGTWKIVWENRDVSWWNSAALGIRRHAWQLYDLSNDPAELNDLSSRQPQRLASMIELWDQYARDNGIILPDRQRGY